MIIGFTGVMGSGKSTAIEYLKERFGSDKVELIKFAGTLYEIQEFIYDKIKPVYKRPADFVKDRKLLQFLGTDWGRETISETIWTDLAINKILQARAQNKIVVIDDVRFDNEAELIQWNNGKVIKLDCKRAEERITTANGFKNHASEVGIDNKFIDYTIDNNSSLEDYRQALCSLFDKLFPSQS